MSIGDATRDCSKDLQPIEKNVLLGDHHSLDLVGDSVAMKRLRLQIERIGPYFRTLLIHGEIGTGKELVARALHQRSRDTGGVFSICYGAALDEAMGEGCVIEQGSPWQPILLGVQGTILVDGVEDMTLRAQARLVEILDRWTRNRPQTRMIAAAGQDLKNLLSTGRFRADLYHRLATIEIAIEPLRRRKEDVPSLARHFVERFNLLYSKGIFSISDKAIQRLQSHDWPGNVRELENIVRNAILRCEGDALDVEHLEQMPVIHKRDHGVVRETKDEERIESLQEVVARHVVRTMDICGGNKVRAAEMLGVSRSTLYRMLDGLGAPDGRVA